MIIITDSFYKKEFKSLKKYYTFDDLRNSIQKTDVSSVNLSHLGYENGKLLKLRIANKVSGRMIVYIFNKGDVFVPIVLRLKKDKVLGENLALNNKKAKDLILKMMDLAMDDIKKERYEKI